MKTAFELVTQHQVELAKKDAEIERLKDIANQLRDIGHQKNRESFSKGLEIVKLEEKIESKDAEIERLKKECAQKEETIEDFLDDVIKTDKLLIRAAEALECHNLDHLQDDLIQELREAAK